MDEIYSSADNLDDLLADLLKKSPWLIDDDDGDSCNRCRFCMGVFSHDKDCWWVRFVALAPD